MADTHVIRRFAYGLLVGSVVSGVAWYLGWNAIDRGHDWLIYVVPAAKVAAAVALGLQPKYRGFGGGLLASIPVGVLIFVSTCASHFRF